MLGSRDRDLAASTLRKTNMELERGSFVDCRPLQRASLQVPRQLSRVTSYDTQGIPDMFLRPCRGSPFLKRESRAPLQGFMAADLGAGLLFRVRRSCVMSAGLLSSP